MSLLLRTAAVLFCLSCVAAARIDAAPQAQQTPASTTDSPGRTILQRKCAQCHAASMWMPLRQDKRAWESTLYRMVGRGALWTQDEIRQMADYLGDVYGRRTP